LTIEDRVTAAGGAIESVVTEAVVCSKDTAAANALIFRTDQAIVAKFIAVRENATLALVADI
jgi:hypothetical protein